MTAAVFLPTPAQRRAADPARSVWVTANAGTGKTRVLSDRVLRLLLAGARPEAILCITFTKAAAAEMAARIEERLARWAVEPDEQKLVDDLGTLLGERPSAGLLRDARRLFARVLDLPRGLNIKTIHALCESLLKRFPLEAGVAPHFETIDDRTATELMVEARGTVLTDRCRRDDALARAVEVLAITLAESTLSGAIEEMLGDRARLAACFARHHPEALCDGLLAHVEGWLGVDEPGLEPPRLLARACEDGRFDHAALADAANRLKDSKGATDKKAADALLGWLNAPPTQRVALLERYKEVFLTKEGQGRKSLCTKALQATCLPALVAEQARLLRLFDAVEALVVARRTGALLRLGHAVIEEYGRLKRQGARLDFDDLIEHTARLLETPGRKEWVLYKLDERLEHVMVDEAQDTSPRQWAIVERLTEEFLAGAGSHAAGSRTLFVVGDEKQSIYSFQGADLANFRAVRERVLRQAETAGQTFAEATLDRSFRSSAAPLEVVDRVLRQEQMIPGVVARGVAVTHETNRKNAPGLVEVWPLAAHAAEESAEPLSWPLPDRPRVTDEPERRVAVAIAQRVRAWLDTGERLESEGRPIRPGDVLILVTRRGRIQELVIRALKRELVPVAGADRLPLDKHIAVRDLVALGRAVLLPEDDLTLASLLKSPLVGLDEDQLFELAWDRGPVGLFERLRDKAEEAGGSPFAEAFDRVAGWMRQADFVPPFEFYAGILGGGGGRRRLLARLGPDAAEPIEAFLSQALAYERGHPATLEGFLHWLELGSQELKRDPEQARDAVRVLTVHGAKGLEAPIVFLANAGPQGKGRDPRILWVEDEAHELPLWRMRKGRRDGRAELAVEAEARRAREEDQRLLYVAMTRARDRLYVTGWQSRRPDAEANPSWHAIVSAALADHPEVESFPMQLGRSYAGDGFRLSRGAPGPAAPAEAAAAPAGPPEPLPAWADAPAPEEDADAGPLSPSRLAADEPAPDSPGGGVARERQRRGILTHRLLQLLPSLPEERRAEAGRAVLARLAADMPDGTREDLLGETLAVLRLPAMAPLTAAGSRAEQPLCGTIAGRMFAGQVDRLAVTDEAVTIVDYKTSRVPPARVEATPLAYLRQMAAYRELLRGIYPGREVRAALLWTQGPRLDVLPPELLDRHTPGATETGAP